MALPITVPYTFGNATTAIPLSNLDSDYATVYQAVNGIGNGSVALANVTITGGTVSNVSGVVPTPFTANGVVYASSTSALTTGSGLKFDGTNLGLSVTPSAWFSDYRTIQLSGSASLSGRTSATGWVQLMSNVFRDASANYLYNATGPASDYRMVDNAYYWYQAPSGTAGNAITFTQAMTLDASGNLLVGTTSATSPNPGIAMAVGGNAQITIGHDTTSSSGQYYMPFKYNASVIGGVTQSGTTAVLYNVTSDYRLKENIQDAAPASALIDAIQVRQFDWKSDGSHQRYGFIAQELVAVAPEAVHQPANPEEMMAVDYSKLVPMLVKEIQSLRQRLSAANL